MVLVTLGMAVTVHCGRKAQLLTRDGMMGLNTFQFIWEVMLTLLYSACIFQKVFSHRVTALQGRNRGYLDVSLGGEQRERMAQCLGVEEEKWSVSRSQPWPWEADTSPDASVLLLNGAQSICLLMSQDLREVTLM